MGNPIAATGVGLLVQDPYGDPGPRRRRSSRLRRRPRPYEAGGPSWEMERLVAPSRLRRSALFSIGIHLVLAVVVLVAMRPRPRPSIRLEIPVQLVRLASPPPSLRDKPRSPELAVDVVREEKKKPKSVVAPKPAPGKKNALAGSQQDRCQDSSARAGAP